MSLAARIKESLPGVQLSPLQQAVVAVLDLMPTAGGKSTLIAILFHIDCTDSTPEALKRRFGHLWRNQ